MMSVALWVLGLSFAAWFCVCVGIAIWYHFVGRVVEHEEGDSLWAVLIVLPFVPFIIGYYKMKEFFFKKSDTTLKD